MKKLHVKETQLWKPLVLFVMGAVLVLLFAIGIQPSDATDQKYEQMIELGLIDEVKSPEALGLDYLHHRPPQLTAGLVENIRNARDRAATQLTNNIAYAIPLGTNKPFAAGQLRNDDGSTLNASHLEGVGYVTPAGRPESLTGRDIVSMLTSEANNGGGLVFFKTREMLVSDANGSLFQTRTIPVIDLICRNKRNNKYYILPNIRADSFCRDVLNAVSNRTYRRHLQDLRNLSVPR